MQQYIIQRARIKIKGAEQNKNNEEKDNNITTTLSFGKCVINFSFTTCSSVLLLDPLPRMHTYSFEVSPLFVDKVNLQVGFVDDRLQWLVKSATMKFCVPEMDRSTWLAILIGGRYSPI